MDRRRNILLLIMVCIAIIGLSVGAQNNLLKIDIELYA